jgi:hypothetical protein
MTLEFPEIHTIFNHSPEKCKYKVPSQCTQKWVKNLDNTEEDILCSIFRFYEQGEFPIAKRVILELRDKINTNSSASSMQNILNVPDSNTSAVTDENSSWKEETLAA